MTSRPRAPAIVTMPRTSAAVRSAVSSRTKDPAIFSASTGSVRRMPSEDCPAPKSSRCTLRPRARSRSMTPVAASRSAETTGSVTSTTTAEAGTSCRSNAPAISSTTSSTSARRRRGRRLRPGGARPWWSGRPRDVPGSPAGPPDRRSRSGCGRGRSGVRRRPAPRPGCPAAHGGRRSPPGSGWPGRRPSPRPGLLRDSAARRQGTRPRPRRRDPRRPGRAARPGTSECRRRRGPGSARRRRGPRRGDLTDQAGQEFPVEEPTRVPGECEHGR